MPNARTPAHPEKNNELFSLFWVMKMPAIFHALWAFGASLYYSSYFIPFLYLAFFLLHSLYFSFL